MPVIFLSVEASLDSGRLEPLDYERHPVLTGVA